MVHKVAVDVMVVVRVVTLLEIVQVQVNQHHQHQEVDEVDSVETIMVFRTIEQLIASNVVDQIIMQEIVKLKQSNVMLAVNWYVNTSVDFPDWQYQGHISRDCTAPNGGPLNATGKTCYKCGQPGHISKDCPTANTDDASIPVDQSSEVNGTDATQTVA